MSTLDQEHVVLRFIKWNAEYEVDHFVYLKQSFSKVNELSQVLFAIIMKLFPNEN